MLHQISELASSAPQDRCLLAGDGPGVAGGAPTGGQDFLFLLVQAEAQEGAASAGRIVLEDTEFHDGEADLTVGLMPGFVPSGSSRGPDATDAAPPAGQDSRPLMPQAEAQGGVASAGWIGPGDTDTNDGAAALTADAMPDFVPSALAWTSQHQPLEAMGRAGTDTSDGRGPGGSMAAEAGPATGTLPDQSNAASSASAIAGQPALDGLPVLPLGLVEPVPRAAPFGTGSPSGPQEEVPLSDLYPAAFGLAAMELRAEPAVRPAVAAKVPPDNAADDDQPAAGMAADLDSVPGGKAAAQDWAEETEAAFALKAESLPAQSTGLAPPPVVGPSLPEARGLSIPADPSMPSVGTMSGHPGSGPSPFPTVASLALPYQRLLHPQLSAQVAPAVLAMGLVPGVDGGPGRLAVAIRPAELGTLQIITERTEEGTARIAVLAERPETLQLLVRDASSLETALRAAGVDEGGGLSLTFGLTNQGPGGGARDARRDASDAPGRGDHTDPKPAIIGSSHAMARTSLLDLSL